MKNTLSIFAILFFAQTIFAQNSKEKSKTSSKKSNSHAAHTMKQEKLRHVVLFKFKDWSSEADIKKVEDTFRDLPKKIKQIVGYEWGLNNSPEGLNQGFTHCFFLTFNSEADRAAYLPHPDHKAFGAVLGPHLDKVLVVDYWVKD